MGRLRVEPEPSPDRDFEFIYRAARGVRWDEVRRALYTPAPDGCTYLDPFQHIVEATAGEYGELLVHFGADPVRQRPKVAEGGDLQLASDLIERAVTQ